MWDTYRILMARERTFLVLSRNWNFKAVALGGRIRSPWAMVPEGTVICGR